MQLRLTQAILVLTVVLASGTGSLARADRGGSRTFARNWAGDIHAGLAWGDVLVSDPARRVGLQVNPGRGESLGVGVGRRLIPGLWLHAELNSVVNVWAAESATSARAISRTEAVLEVPLLLRSRLEDGGSLHPYLQVGPAWDRLGNLNLHYGGGIDFDLSPVASILVDLRYRLGLGARGDADEVLGSYRPRTLLLSTGLRF